MVVTAGFGPDILVKVRFPYETTKLKYYDT